MRAYHIQQPETGTDFMDVWTELESSVIKVTITPIETTVSEFNELVKNNVNGPEVANKE